MKHRLVHLVIQRPVREPRTVRWYIRYVWLEGAGVTRDRVMAQGEREVGDLEGTDLVRQVLLDAAAELDR